MKDKAWDIIDINFSRSALGSIFQALLFSDGKLLTYDVIRYRECVMHRWPATLRITLPIGSEEEFEKMSGVKLQEIPQVEKEI